MPSLKVITAQGEELAVPLAKETLIVGRSKDVEISLHDDGISRQHAQFRKVGTTYLIKDLNSFNGTILNDALLEREVPLSPGDRIRIGQTVMTYLADDAPSTTASMRLGADDPEFQASVFKADQLPYTRLGPDVHQGDQGTQHLLLLNHLSREVMAIHTERELAAFLAQHLMDWFQVDCCAVVYHQPTADGYQLDIQSIVCSTPGQVRDLTISHTAARQVIEEKMALLITNARQDTRFKAQQSILSRGIISILCAPLWHEDQVFGLLYLDTTEQTDRLTREHLGLLSAMANLAAIKIDNLRLFAAAMAKAALDKELELAAHIQAKLLPGDSLTFANVRCLGFNRACAQVGGDYFDFIPLNEDVLTVTIADVAGHGPAGALLMAACKSTLTALIDTGLPLQDRIARLNRYLLKHVAAHQFITFFHGEIDRRTQVLTYCNAGHNAPILLPGDGEVQVLPPKEMPLGIMEVPYSIRTAPFPSGTKLVLYTDGITETRNAQEEEYGEARLLELVCVHRMSPASVLREAILRAVDQFAAGVEHQDDVTLALVECAV